MNIFHNIGTVAKYEARILRRSWFFRLFALGAIFIFTILNIGLFSPIGDESWQLVAISSAVPLLNLYMLNIAQSIVVIFLAADFLKRDKKVDTNEVLYTRSMSNFEYITGKTWGILRLFLSLDILILGIGLLINIISKNMTVNLLSYLQYLLIIPIPTIIFSLGLAFVLMSLIKNQAVTFLVLLGIAASNMFWGWFRFGYIFDYMAFGLPVFRSNILGFVNPDMIINQRLMFFSAGMAMILATILLFRRLPQSKTHTIFTWILMFICFSTAAYSGYTSYSTYKLSLANNQALLETNKLFEEESFLALKEASIELLHDGARIEAEASLFVTNETSLPVNKILLSLNPELEVFSVEREGTAVKWEREGHMLIIESAEELLPGSSDTIMVKYGGGIDESFCFPDYKGNAKDNAYRIEMLNIEKKQAFLTDTYVLLIPETHWYPVPALNYYPGNPARQKIDFTMFNLTVTSNSGLRAISQGEAVITGEKTIYKTREPITGLTLALGNYLTDTLKVDSITYINNYFRGNDYYKEDLALLKDTLPTLISGFIRDMESAFSASYPFHTLTFVEVPVQFYSYPRRSTQTRAEVQPSLVLLPERLTTVNNAGFQKRFTRQKKNNERSNQVVTDKELQVRLLNNFIRNAFISGESFRYVNGNAINEPVRYRLGASFYYFRNNFRSEEYPVINSVFESHLQKVVNPQSGYIYNSGTLADNDKANLILKDKSFREALATNPGIDTVSVVVSLKGDQLFNLLRSKAGIQEFNKWFKNYLTVNKFRNVDLRQFNEDVKKEFGFEFYSELDNWFNGKLKPGFLFSDVSATEIVVDERVRYLVTFTVSNPEPVSGIFNVGFRTGQEASGSGQATSVVMSTSGVSVIVSQGRGIETSDLSRIIIVGPHEARRISIVLDNQPREMAVNTILSKNLPGELSIGIEQISKSRSRYKPEDENIRLDMIPLTGEQGELIVDNEDAGFINNNSKSQVPLKKILGVKESVKADYEQTSMYNVPEYFQPTINTNYYGKYVMSAVYARKGEGDRSVSWTTVLADPGYYDIYCYIGKSPERVTVGTSGPGAPPAPPPSQENSQYKDMNYKVYHDEGVDDIQVDFQQAEPGWYNLGRFYLSADTVRVDLTNKSSGRIVLGDAVKWVKAN